MQNSTDVGDRENPESGDIRGYNANTSRILRSVLRKKEEDDKNVGNDVRNWSVMKKRKETTYTAARSLTWEPWHDLIREATTSLLLVLLAMCLISQEVLWATIWKLPSQSPIGREKRDITRYEKVKRCEKERREKRMGSYKLRIHSGETIKETIGEKRKRIKRGGIYVDKEGGRGVIIRRGINIARIISARTSIDGDIDGGIDDGINRSDIDVKEIDSIYPVCSTFAEKRISKSIEAHVNEPRIQSTDANVSDIIEKSTVKREIYLTDDSAGSNTKKNVFTKTCLVGASVTTSIKKSIVRSTARTLIKPPSADPNSSSLAEKNIDNFNLYAKNIDENINEASIVSICPNYSAFAEEHAVEEHSFEKHIAGEDNIAEEDRVAEKGRVAEGDNFAEEDKVAEEDRVVKENNVAEDYVESYRSGRRIRPTNSYSSASADKKRRFLTDIDASTDNLIVKSVCATKVNLTDANSYAFVEKIGGHKNTSGVTENNIDGTRFSLTYSNADDESIVEHSTVIGKRSINKYAGETTI